MPKAHYKILVKGKRIQRAMFRDFVDEIARDNQLTGFVCNLTNPPRDVLIECEGEEEGIKKLINKLEQLKAKKQKGEELTESALMLIDLQQIIIEKSEYTARYSDFEIIRREGELGERMAEGAHQMMQLRKEFSGKFGYLDEKYGDISKELRELNKNLTTIIKKFVENQSTKTI